MHSANSGPGPSPTPMTLNEIVHALTTAGTYAQPYNCWKYNNRTGKEHRTWNTHHLSFLSQLDYAITQRAVVGKWRPIPPGMSDTKTQPHFDADAFDRRQQIGKEVGNYLAYLHLQSASQKIAGTITGNLIAIEYAIKTAHPLNNTTAEAVDVLRECAAAIRRSTEPDLRLLVDAEMDDDTHAALVRDARHWLTWCRIFGGWEVPPARPRVTCPECQAPQDKDSGLRVRFDDPGATDAPSAATVQAAVCISCNTTWDERTIGLLTQHIGEEIDPDAPMRNQPGVGIADAAEIVHDGGWGHGSAPNPRADPP